VGHTENAGVIPDRSEIARRAVGPAIPIHVVISPTLVVALDAAFEGGPLQATEKVAKLLGISARTLQRLGDERKIRHRPKGTAHRQYTRDDVEAHLARAFTWAHTYPDERTPPPNRLAGTTTFGSGPRAQRRLQRGHSHAHRRHRLAAFERMLNGQGTRSDAGRSRMGSNRSSGASVAR
jgi:hypothetical protein